MVNICGVVPVVFHDRPREKPVTTVAVLQWVRCWQVATFTCQNMEYALRVPQIRSLLGFLQNRME
jgi:hypothetical protein